MRRARTPPRNPQSNKRTQSNTLIPCPCGRAPRQNALLRRLQPPSGAAAVQRGEKRIQGGSRGNSQSPYPSLAAGGSHAAAASSNSGARTPLHPPQCIIKPNKQLISCTQSKQESTLLTIGQNTPRIYQHRHQRVYPAGIEHQADRGLPRHRHQHRQTKQVCIIDYRSKHASHLPPSPSARTPIQD